MKRLLFTMLCVCNLLVCDLASGFSHAADPTSPPASGEEATPGKIATKPMSMYVITLASGLKTLSIHFPWSIYPNSSVEVRLLPAKTAKRKNVAAVRNGDAIKLVPLTEENERIAPFTQEVDEYKLPDDVFEKKGVEVPPILFHAHLKGKVQDDFFDCLDHPDDGGKVHSFTKDKIVYKMIGRRNNLGNQGVHVVTSSETPKKADLSSAAFLQLDTWAIDKETLSFDLPRDEFAEPGLLIVWFYRGDKVVWQEQVKWPGYR